MKGRKINIGDQFNEWTVIDNNFISKNKKRFYLDRKSVV